MRQQDRLVAGTAALLRVARLANRLFLAAVVIGLGATWLVPSFFTALLREAGAAIDMTSALQGLRILLLIGIIMAIAIDRLLVSLAAITASVNEGDPFVPANASRLYTMGWALLILQLLDIPAALLTRYWPSLGSAAPEGGVSIGGWLATLMVFVLARVFAAGSAMRDELAGTV
jgi:hypothetical protein